MEPDQRTYVAQLLEQYQQLHGTRHRVLRDDRRTALALHDRRIGLDLVRSAFLLATARRAFRDGESLAPICTLRYFLPVIDEILADPLDPGYLEHVEFRLRNAGLIPPA